MMVTLARLTEDLILLVALACGNEALPSPDAVGATSPDAVTQTPSEPTTAPVERNPVPEGLPTHLSLGLASRPEQIGGMVNSGILWDFRYQYLSGGVNTGDGWATWNSPPGRFAARYVNASGQNGYLPVFTYYQIVPSHPDPGSEDTGPKLQDASTMEAYFGDWKLLMETVGALDEPVVLHHEPDLWGTMQQGNDDPTKIAVAVESSGFDEVSGFENNARGFAQALVALRDRYAPDAILAWHASHWATGEDLILDNGDPIAIGRQIAAFFNALDADFDLIFFDPSDRDAGFFEIVREDRGAPSWDDSHFVTYRQFIRTIVDATGRRAMLWQIPIGNTLYRSSDNTRGHYQDNRVQYFLGDGAGEHIAEYVDAGVIGILIGRGTGGQSNYLDSADDGITNPPPINGNDLTSEYADDDGGFLRLSAEAYYAGVPISLDAPP